MTTGQQPINLFEFEDIAKERLPKEEYDYIAGGATDAIVIVAENPSRTLYKISEIYDRIAFAGVGKYNEFEMLRIAGVRQADVKGYSFAREDVNARALANAYAQTLGQIFTHEMKPYEVEILVAQVGAAPPEDELFHILYDGTVMDEEGFTVLGGQSEQIAEALAAQFQAPLDRAATIKLGATVLAAPDSPPLEASVRLRTRRPTVRGC